MRVVVYPADTGGCGYFRLIWPAELLAAAGHDVEIRPPEDRGLKLRIGADDRVEDVLDVGGVDVLVFQRLTHEWMAAAVPLLRAKGIAVVVDVDDDLTTVHPRNPAYESMHPRFAGRVDPRTRQVRRHSWQHLADACRAATLVTVSTPALLDRYARHGRGHVIHNHLPDSYFGAAHEDSGVVGWPASLASHPDDPAVLGGAVARLVSEGAAFRVVGDPTGTGAAFGLTADPPGRTGVDVHGWPAAVARDVGIGIAPLADTAFNRAKSWLKPLELSALGVPWVASPRAEYARLHERGAGVLADTPRRWYRELRRLVDNPALRAERAEAGRAVAEGLRLSANAWRWAEAWERAHEVQKTSRMCAA
ncbi:glycosyltransferase [Streptomyces sp. NPDC126497]|uniref:glycosyltransferase family protein n=1 Tax=Streptomyces sp. NPDC126497 TaxID=3155313 RepID=UPI00331CB719